MIHGLKNTDLELFVLYCNYLENIRGFLPSSKNLLVGGPPDSGCNKLFLTFFKDWLSHCSPVIRPLVFATCLSQEEMWYYISYLSAPVSYAVHFLDEIQ